MGLKIEYHSNYYVEGMILRIRRSGNMNVHGAGAQRSDPKSGNPADYPSSFGLHGDARRLLNYVCCVRGGTSDQVITDGTVHQNQENAQVPSNNQGQMPWGGKVADNSMVDKVRYPKADKMVILAGHRRLT